MKYKNYLFDWDGSLGDTLPLWFDLFQGVLGEMGVKTDYLTIGEVVMGDWRGPERMGVSGKEFFEKAEIKLFERLVDVKLNLGARELIERIKAEGGKVGVLTSSKRAWVEPVLRKLGIHGQVDVFLGKEDVENYKPDPEIIEKAILKLGGLKTESVMIGDTDKDIWAAKTAGIDGILYFPVRYKDFYREERQLGLGATRVIEDFGEVE